ncbi:hypothetical protein TFLX_05740 [Thermoflexales bacterium]|nr:hypothetical protein TFLX_05740 [Thermoflexales bacterium]
MKKALLVTAIVLVLIIALTAFASASAWSGGFG